MEASFLILCLVALTVLILLTLLGVVIYSGLFTTVNPGAGPPPIKGVTLAYKFGRGPYKDTGYYFTQISSLAPKLRCIGVYYDDPKQVPSEKLRWAVGCIVSEGEEMADLEQVKLLRDKGYKLFNFPPVSNAVKCTFPYNTFLSIFIGIFRVYPLMGEYVRINKLCAHPWMEIYDGDSIHYMAPLARQDEFYVPQATCEGSEEVEDGEVEMEPLEDQPSTSGMQLRKTDPEERGDGDKAKKEIDVKEEKTDKAEKTEMQPEKDRETSSKPKVTDSSGKRSPSEEIGGAKSKSSDIVQECGISSTSSTSLASDNSMSPSPQPESPASPATSASDGSMTMSESSMLTTTTDASSFMSTDAEGMSYTSTEASQGTLSGFSSGSEADMEPFEVVKKEDAQ